MLFIICRHLSQTFNGVLMRELFIINYDRHTRKRPQFLYIFAPYNVTSVPRLKYKLNISNHINTINPTLKNLKKKLVSVIDKKDNLVKKQTI